MESGASCASAAIVKTDAAEALTINLIFRFIFILLICFEVSPLILTAGKLGAEQGWHHGVLSYWSPDGGNGYWTMKFRDEGWTGWEKGGSDNGGGSGVRIGLIRTESPTKKRPPNVEGALQN